MNCGTQSSDYNVCESCHKELPDNPKWCFNNNNKSLTTQDGGNSLAQIDMIDLQMHSSFDKRKKDLQAAKTSEVIKSNQPAVPTKDTASIDDCKVSQVLVTLFHNLLFTDETVPPSWVSQVLVTLFHNLLFTDETVPPSGERKASPSTFSYRYMK